MSPALTPTPKSRLEQLRLPLTWLLMPAWLLFMIATRPEGFQTVPYEVLEMGGMLLIFAAVLGRLWCSLYISGRKDKELCTTGPYSLSRNPLYFFSLLGLAGVCLASQNVILLIVSVCAFFGYYSMVIASEEKRLRELFPVEFDRYVARTPAFLPSFKRPLSEEKVLVNARAFLRAMIDAGWFLVAIIGLELLEAVHASAQIPVWTLPF